MDEDATSRPGIWHRTGFGCRVLSPQPPYFVISPPSHREHRDAFRRQALADLAHLTELLSETRGCGRYDGQPDKEELGARSTGLPVALRR